MTNSRKLTNLGVLIGAGAIALGIGATAYVDKRADEWDGRYAFQEITNPDPRESSTEYARFKDNVGYDILIRADDAELPVNLKKGSIYELSGDHRTLLLDKNVTESREVPTFYDWND